MAPPSNLAGLLAGPAQTRRLDLAALLAIAGHEGAGGGIGDNGHAFGPFQLNDAGGVLTGQLQGESPQQKNAWAWSPAGIKFALDGIARVASGLHGGQAVRAIATRFERPANVQAEIQDALAHYGGGQSRTLTGSAPRPPVPSPGGGSSGIDSLLGHLIGSTNDSLGLGGSSSIGGLLSSSQLPNPPAGRASAPVAPFPNPPTGSHGGIAELLQEGTGGPTHSTGPHIHAAFTNPQLELAAIQWAQQHGLNVGENPYVGSLSPGVHAPHSYHNVTFPGLFNGRKLGEAVDVSGPGMGAFYKFLAARR